MRILICDDNIIFSKNLEQLLRVYFQKKQLKLPEITIYDSGENLLADSGEKDIVFLDIEMPGLSGIYIGQEIKKTNKNTIIFVITSFSEYLDDAMRIQVFRYLSKPLDKLRLYRNLKEALQIYATTNTTVLIETKEMVYSVPVSDIIYVEAQGHRVTVFTLMREYSSVHTLKKWQQLLDIPCFFQTHRSFLVNLKYVSRFDHSLVYLCDNKYKAYLTKRKYTKFKEAYLLYLESIH